MTSIVLLMPMLNDGTEVWRPVTVKTLDDGTYQILGPMPDDEQWNFAPGSIGTSQLRTFAKGEEQPVASPLAQPSPTCSILKRTLRSPRDSR
jgi:hypothetical protein